MKDDSIYLGHMYEKTLRILDITQGLSFEEFSSNFLIQDSVIRSFEVIGEAANKLSDIPISQMVGLKNSNCSPSVKILSVSE